MVSPKQPTVLYSIRGHTGVKFSYIEEKKVFVNGKIITSNGYSIKENDIISVRGLGRVIYNRQISVTKKGKNLVSVSIYC